MLKYIIFFILSFLSLGCENLFAELDISHAKFAMRSKLINCETLTGYYLNRIETYDQSTGLNAIVTVNPNAMIKAKALDKKFAKTGTMRKLHCIPVIVKDNYDTADMPTEAGSLGLQGSFPPDDAFMVRKLREQDAIIIAKSNMAEFAFSPFATISSTHGETLNAYDLTRVPAGSSGGTASAIAANFAIIGMGTDTGNSIRGPASHLSLVGIRSTIGATSRDGIVPLLLNRDIAGPLVRTVKDAAIVYSVIAGYDPADPVTLAVKNKKPRKYIKSLKKNGLKGARLGVLRQIVDLQTADPEVLALMEQAIKDLEAAGAEIVDPFEIEAFDELKNATGFCLRFQFDFNNYLQTLSEQRPVQSLQEVFDRGLYLQENAGTLQFLLSVTGDPQLQTPPCIDVQGDPRRKQFLDATLAAMDLADIDAIIYPSWSNPPRLLGDLTSPHGNNSPVIAPHTGQPAITVPMGFVSGDLPAGLQFLARPFDEHKLFRYAFAYEQATHHRHPPRGFGLVEISDDNQEKENENENEND